MQKHPQWFGRSPLAHKIYCNYRIRIDVCESLLKQKEIVIRNPNIVMSSLRLLKHQKPQI